MSGRKTYLVRSDCMDMQFTRENEAAAVRQLHVSAAATPDVQHDLYKLDERLGVLDWVASVVESAPLG